jgi:hypothetical protein
MIVLAGMNVGVQTYPEFKCPVHYSTGDKELVEDCKRWNYGGGSSAASDCFGDGGVIDT